MENLNPLISRKVYEVIHMANFALDRNLLRNKVLDVLFNTLYAESSVFFIPDEQSRSTGGIERNLGEKYVKQYKEYYWLHDPIQFMQGSFYQERVVQLDELIDYDSFVTSRFYCDFLRPQNIHHKLYINLNTGAGFQGRIALYRPAKSNRFSPEEVNILRTISPYLAHALDHNELRINIKRQDSILEIIEQNWSTGLILLDDSMRLVYMNQKAKEFCRDLVGYPSFKDMNIRVPPILLEDCHAIAEELKGRPADGIVLPKRRAILINSSEKFSVCSQLVEKEVSSETCRLFMISIDEMNRTRRIDEYGLKESYHLTKREMDIILHIFKGLRNSEIAERLFLSETTVKKHIQNIFQKVAVKNRTALIHRILDKEDILSG